MKTLLKKIGVYLTIAALSVLATILFIFRKTNKGTGEPIPQKKDFGKIGNIIEKYNSKLDKIRAEEKARKPQESVDTFKDNFGG